MTWTHRSTYSEVVWKSGDCNYSVVYPNPSLASHAGEELHGVVYPPIGVQEGKQYPTVLYTYGGPAIQVELLESFSGLVLIACLACYSVCDKRTEPPPATAASLGAAWVCSGDDRQSGLH